MPFTVKIGDATHEISRDQIVSVEEGYSLKKSEEIDTIVKNAKDSQRAKLTKDFDAEKAAIRKTLASDDDFFSELAKARGVSTDGSDPEKLAAAKEQWAKDELAPMQKKHEELLQELTSSRKRVLMGSIEAAARDAGVREEFLNDPLDPSAPGHVVRSIADRASWDDESGAFVFTNDGRRSYPWTADYKKASVKFMIDRLKANEKAGAYFTDTRPGRTGVGDKKRGASYSGKTMTMEHFKYAADARASATIERGNKQGQTQTDRLTAQPQRPPWPTR